MQRVWRWVGFVFKLDDPMRQGAERHGTVDFLLGLMI